VTAGVTDTNAPHAEGASLVAGPGVELPAAVRRLLEAQGTTVAELRPDTSLVLEGAAGTAVEGMSGPRAAVLRLKHSLGGRLVLANGAAPVRARFFDQDGRRASPPVTLRPEGGRLEFDLPALSSPVVLVIEYLAESREEPR
jgi:hypothetical protein